MTSTYLEFWKDVRLENKTLHNYLIPRWRKELCSLLAVQPNLGPPSKSWHRWLSNFKLLVMLESVGLISGSFDAQTTLMWSAIRNGVSKCKTVNLSIQITKSGGLSNLHCMTALVCRTGSENSCPTESIWWWLERKILNRDRMMPKVPTLVSCTREMWSIAIIMSRLITMGCHNTVLESSYWEVSR